MGELQDVLNALENHDKKQVAKQARVKQAKRTKKTETLDEGFERVLHLKLKDTEREIVQKVKRLVLSGILQRTATGKLSKKEVFELWKIQELKEREVKKQKVLDTKPSNYWIIQDIQTLEKVRTLLKNEKITAWDTETTGLDLYNHRVIGYSAYLPKANLAFYVPFGHTTGQTQVSEEDALKVAKEYLENPENKTIWHHYKFDGHMLLNHDITVANPYWDTQPVAKLLNEHESHRLKDLHAKYILKSKEAAIMFEDLFDDAVIYDKDVILAGIYASGDAHKTFQLYDFQKPFIDTRDNLKTVWYEIEQPLLQVDLAMERTGFRIDLDGLEKLRIQFEPILIESEQAIRTAFNIDASFIQKMSETLGKKIEEFNIQSNEHLGYLIYDVLGVDPTIGLRFKKPLRSTGTEVIDAIVKDHEALKPLKQYRQLNKLITTYIKKIPLAMEPATGRLHARFNNLAGDEGSEGTATGRYSSSEYVSGKNSATGDVAKGTNFQNISSKGEGVKIRNCFIPDDNFIFIGSDLSQIEPRIISVILAEQYGDTAMQQFYKDGKDLYTEMAMMTFGFEREYCVDGAYDPSGKFQPRKLLKQGVLSYLYGTSAKSFARTMKVSDEVAEEFFEGMLTAFHGLKPFKEDTIKKLLTEGPVAHIETMYGRKRRFLEYRKEYAELQELNKIKWGKATPEQTERRNYLWKRCAYAERAAINARIQGTAADVLKQNMIAMYRFCMENGYKFHCSIHDEVIISVPRFALTTCLIEKVNDIMINTVKLSTPLKSDTVIMERWGDEIKPADWNFQTL